jgi:hypothetical protein
VKGEDEAMDYWVVRRTSSLYILQIKCSLKKIERKKERVVA